MYTKLIQSAGNLVQPPVAALEEFAFKRDQLAGRGNQTLAERHDLEKLVGAGNRRMAEDNNRNFARFMASLFSDYDPKVFVETVLWVFRAYRAHGFQTTYWAANLNIWVDMLQSELSPESTEAIYPFYNWLIVNIPLFVALSDEKTSPPAEADPPEHE